MSTLAEIIDRVEADLKDTANATWTAAELTQHIRRALADYALVNPARASVDITPSAGNRQIDLSSIDGLTDIVDVWYPLDPSNVPHPPPRCLWSLLDALTLYLDESDAPTGSADEQVRVFYTRPQTIEDLDGASSTSVPPADEYIIVMGATAYAMQQHARNTIGTVTVSGWTPRQLQDWASARADEFRARLEGVRHRMALIHDPRVTWKETL